MFWDDKKKPDDEKPETLVSKFFRTCLLALAGVFLLWLALQLLGQIWGYLLLIAAAAGIVWAAVWLVRWYRDRRW